MTYALTARPSTYAPATSGRSEAGGLAAADDGSPATATAGS